MGDNEQKEDDNLLLHWKEKFKENPDSPYLKWAEEGKEKLKDFDDKLTEADVNYIMDYYRKKLQRRESCWRAYLDNNKQSPYLSMKESELKVILTNDAVNDILDYKKKKDYWKEQFKEKPDSPYLKGAEEGKEKLKDFDNGLTEADVNYIMDYYETKQQHRDNCWKTYLDNNKQSPYLSMKESELKENLTNDAVNDVMDYKKKNPKTTLEYAEISSKPEFRFGKSTYKKLDSPKKFENPTDSVDGAGGDLKECNVVPNMRDLTKEDLGLIVENSQLGYGLDVDDLQRVRPACNMVDFDEVSLTEIDLLRTSPISEEWVVRTLENEKANNSEVMMSYDLVVKAKSSFLSASGQSSGESKKTDENKSNQYSCVAKLMAPGCAFNFNTEHFCSCGYIARRDNDNEPNVIKISRFSSETSSNEKSTQTLYTCKRMKWLKLRTVSRNIETVDARRNKRGNSKSTTKSILEDVECIIRAIRNDYPSGDEEKSDNRHYVGKIDAMSQPVAESTNGKTMKLGRNDENYHCPSDDEEKSDNGNVVGKRDAMPQPVAESTNGKTMTLGRHDKNHHCPSDDEEKSDNGNVVGKHDAMSEGGITMTMRRNDENDKFVPGVNNVKQKKGSPLEESAKSLAHDYMKSRKQRIPQKENKYVSTTICVGKVKWKQLCCDDDDVRKLTEITTNFLVQDLRKAEIVVRGLLSRCDGMSLWEVVRASRNCLRYAVQENMSWSATTKKNVTRSTTKYEIGQNWCSYAHDQIILLSLVEKSEVQFLGKLFNSDERKYFEKKLDDIDLCNNMGPYFHHLYVDIENMFEEALKKICYSYCPTGFELSGHVVIFASALARQALSSPTKDLMLSSFILLIFATRKFYEHFEHRENEWIQTEDSISVDKNDVEGEITDEDDDGENVTTNVGVDVEVEHNGEVQTAVSLTYSNTAFAEKENLFTVVSTEDKGIETNESYLRYSFDNAFKKDVEIEQNNDNQNQKGNGVPERQRCDCKKKIRVNPDLIKCCEDFAAKENSSDMLNDFVEYVSKNYGLFFATAGFIGLASHTEISKTGNVGMTSKQKALSVRASLNSMFASGSGGFEGSNQKSSNASNMNSSSTWCVIGGVSPATLKSPRTIISSRSHVSTWRVIEISKIVPFTDLLNSQLSNKLFEKHSDLRKVVAPPPPPPPKKPAPTTRKEMLEKPPKAGCYAIGCSVNDKTMYTMDNSSHALKLSFNKTKFEVIYVQSGGSLFYIKSCQTGLYCRAAGKGHVTCETKKSKLKDENKFSAANNTIYCERDKKPWRENKSETCHGGNQPATEFWLEEMK